jgi:hypothetical protein
MSTLSVFCLIHFEYIINNNTQFTIKEKKKKERKNFIER